MKLLDQELVERLPGVLGVDALAEHPIYGRLLVQDGLDACQRIMTFERGRVIKLRAGDTLQSLHGGRWNDATSLWEAVSKGYDYDRPVLPWNGSMVVRTATALGLIQ